MLVVVIAMFISPFSAQAEYTGKEFMDRVAACAYPFFAAGMKTSLTGSNRNQAIENFSKNLLSVVKLDMPLTDNSLNYLCDQYKNTSDAKAISRSEFIDFLQNNGMGDLVTAFKNAH